MTKLCFILISALAASPAILTAAVAPVVKIELTPKAWFTKPQTFIVPVAPDGSTTEARSGIEQTFFSEQSQSVKNGPTVTEQVANKEFFGVIATVSTKDDRTAVNLTVRKLVATNSSADGLSTSPQISEANFQSSFSGTTLEAKLPGFDDFKRVRFTILPENMTVKR